MLKQIRSKLTSTLVFALLGVLIASFALWGVGGGFVQQGSVVASVEGTNITTFELDRAFRNEVERLREQLGGDFDTQQALAMGVQNLALNQLVDRTLLDVEAGRLDLYASDAQVQREIMSVEAFRDLGGNFSRLLYDQQLSYSGYTPEEFEDSVRADIARTQLIEGLLDAAPVPPALVEALYRHRKETRTARVLAFPAADAAGIPEPTEEQLRAYYDAYSEAYMHPEYRDLRFLIVSPEDFAARAEFTEEELRAEYERRADEFDEPETREVEVAVFRDERQARAFFERVQAGADFTATAVEMTGFSAGELQLGEVTRNEIAQNYSDVAAERVFTADVGDVTEPSSTLLAWQVFHVTGVTPGITRTFEEVRPELEQALAEERGIDQLYDTVGVIDDELAAGASFDQVVQVTGLKPLTLEAVSARGRTRGGETVAESPALPYLDEAFQLEPGHELHLENGEGDDEFYLAVVDQVYSPEPIPFEQVRDEVRRNWLNEQRLLKAGEVANAALEEFRAGRSLEEISAEYGGRVFPIGPFQRDRVMSSRELAPAIANLMFSLGEGEAGVEQQSGGQGYLLLQVTGITPGDPAANRGELVVLRAQLQNALQEDLFGQLQAALRKDLDVSINREAVEQLFSGTGPALTSPF